MRRPDSKGASRHIDVCGTQQSDEGSHDSDSVHARLARSPSPVNPTRGAFIALRGVPLILCQPTQSDSDHREGCGLA